MSTRFLPSVFRPDACHVHGRKPPFFEGWYYKLVDATHQHSLAIIPGIALDENPSESHAFVQYFHSPENCVVYQRYEIDDFWSARRRFEITIGPNRFSADRVVLDVQTPEHTLRGSLRFRDLAPWPVTLRSPGIMGWYAWVPLMECYHGVVSLDHKVEGTVDIDERHTSFDEGRGYTEKDWGRSFPEAWVWFQTNHFEQSGTSLIASIAVIPWLRRPFAGFIIGLWHSGRLYRFATYTGARTERLEVDNTHVQWTVCDRHHRLKMSVTRSSGQSLLFPLTSAKVSRVVETLDATVSVRLDEIRRGTSATVFRGTGRHAGLDVGGNTQQLLDLLVGGRAADTTGNE